MANARSRYSRARLRAKARRPRKRGGSLGWGLGIAIVLVLGVGAIVVSRAATSYPAGQGPNDHWHAAFGANVCGQWVPNPAQFLTQHDNPSLQAGIHTHNDGIIHFEPYFGPNAADDAAHATVGRWFKYGGWQLNTTSFNFNGVSKKNGDTCPATAGKKAQKGVVTWAVNKKEHSGNLGDFAPNNGDSVVLAFLPAGRNAASPRRPAVEEEPSERRQCGEQFDADPERATPAHNARNNAGVYAGVDSVKAIVLVGGEGTRLRPLTYTTPKPLLPIANQAFLERQLAWLARHGVDEVVLSLGYLPDAFREHFPDDRFEDVKLRYRVESEPLGTAGGIQYAADGIDERLVVCNGDVLTSLDLGAMVAFHTARGADATIALTQVADPSAFGVVSTGDDGEVRAFVEKPPPGAAPSDWINAGTYVLEPSVLDRIPPDLKVSIERETFPHMVAEPGRLYAMRSDAYWLDIGTPDTYLQAHTDVLAGRLGMPPAPGAIERSPGLWVQGDANIHADARVEAPVLVGPGSTIAAGARVAGSVLGAGCVVDTGARVLRSVLFDGARLDTEAEAIDAVIGSDAVLAADAIATDQTVVGAAAIVTEGSRVSGARIHLARGTW